MQPFLILAIAGLIGYYTSARLTAPVIKKGQTRPNKLPTFRIGNIEILPCLRIHTKSSTIWLHHWAFLLAGILSAVLFYDNIMHFTTAKALTGGLSGAIIQGLTYPDRFKFKHPRLKK